jgi:hypothetical protein
MNIQLKKNLDYENNFDGTYCVYLNGRPVGNDADKVVLHTQWHKLGFKNIYVGKPNGHEKAILGQTKTDKSFEIFGGHKWGGSHNDWFLVINDITIAHAKNAKSLLQLLVCIEWTDEQIQSSNDLYKRRMQ